MLFSEKYNIKTYWEKEWFNPVLETDVPLFIDPYLIEGTTIPEFENSRKKINIFFKEIIEMIIKYHAKGKKKEIMDIMKNVIIFPEVNQLCLGYSENTKGSGTGGRFAKDVYHAIIDFIKELGMNSENFTHIEILTLFSKGISYDGVSDIVANLLKEELIQYTQRICKENNIPLKKLPLRHIKLNKETFTWDDGHVNLPENPYTHEAILLVPKKFLRRSQTFNNYTFRHFLWNQDSEILRRKLNITLQSQLDKEAILQYIKENPKKLGNYFNSFYGKGKEKKVPYNYVEDKNFIYYKEFIPSLIRNALPKPEFKTQYTNKELFNFVVNLVNEFKHFIENQDGYELLRNPANSEPFKEPHVQLVFYSTIKLMCEEHNIEVSRESSAANGRIEFKFSQGHGVRMHLEIKLAKEQKKLNHGYQEQLPKYMVGEKINQGLYLAIGFNNEEITKIQNLKKLKLNSKYSKLKIKIVDIDARVKKSSFKDRIN